MRSFGLSVFATLALAAFSYAAPMVAGVNAIAARHEDHTKSVSLEVVLTTAIELVTPITNELGCLTSDNATLAVIEPLIEDLKDVLEIVIDDVKELVGLPLDRILCTLVGGVLDAVSIAGLLSCLLNLVLGACASVYAVVSITIKVQVCSLLYDVACLVGSILCGVLDLVVDLVVDIVACILPQITGCLDILGVLDVKVIISTLGL